MVDKLNVGRLTFQCVRPSQFLLKAEQIVQVVGFFIVHTSTAMLCHIVENSTVVKYLNFEFKIILFTKKCVPEKIPLER